MEKKLLDDWRLLGGAGLVTDQELADLFAYLQSMAAPEPVGKIPLLKD